MAGATKTTVIQSGAMNPAAASDTKRWSGYTIWPAGNPP